MMVALIVPLFLSSSWTLAAGFKSCIVSRWHSVLQLVMCPHFLMVRTALFLVGQKHFDFIVLECTVNKAVM